MKILSPAKINLFLQVTGKRPDGYHELFSLICCVSLFDTIILHFGGEKIALESSHPQIPLDDTNLAYKAADLFLKNMHSNDGVRIILDKSIPVAAGLGGGSSNAASVLKGLNHHYDNPFSREQLMSMGLCLGADGPFFLFEKPALATGIGEKLEAYPEVLPYHVILVNPGFKVSTGEVFQNLNLRLTKCKKKITKSSLMKTGYDVCRHLCNDLEAVTALKFPEIDAIKAQLLEQGALGALMSGSGPTVFGLFSDSKTAGRAMPAIARNSRWNVYSAAVITAARPAES
jgi:4-diphosphocytidyl-2-C-methyl-D-erythritol kinase